MLGLLDQTPAAPTAELLVSKGIKTDLQVSRRPANQITIEEMRFDLASRVGPLRLQAAKVTTFELRAGIPVFLLVGKGVNGLPTFVRIELVRGYKPIDLDLSNQREGGSAILTTNTFSAVDLIVRSGEDLYATAHNITEASGITRIKVSEVII